MSGAKHFDAEKLEHYLPTIFTSLIVKRILL